MPDPKKKILVVDDDSVIRKSLWFKLNNSGYQVLSATDGSEAVSVTRKEKPDLILLDLAFPPDVAHGGGVPWDGFLIIDWLRRLDEAKGIPIIVITGSEAEKFKDRALAKGAIAFFHKPIDEGELMSTIHRILGDVPPAGSPPAK